jgi:hypothetical protein
LHGFNNFNHHSFNRNGFANRVAWNRWEHRFPHNCCGWFGPVFWPFFIGDIYSAVLWPWYDYDPFWLYGSDYILSSIFWTGWGGGVGYAANDVYDIYGSQYGYQAPRSSFSSNRRAVGNRIAAANGPAEQAAFGEACSGLAPGTTDLPFERIQREIQPTGDQLTAFDALKSATSRAREMIKASCSHEVPLTPVRRLDVVETRLNTMEDVMRTVSGPLHDFYDSLAEGQRQRLDALGSGARQLSPKAASGNGLPALCSERAEAFSQVPVQRIEETIHPTSEQQGAFDALKTASSQAADRLRSSCPAEMPRKLVDRMQAVDARLAAMLSAVKVVRPALDGFYALLSDEQKARFNSWGQPQTQARTNSG